MYRLIYMKADFEPWWKFEGWEEYIVSIQQFESSEACEVALYEKLEHFRKLYDFEACKKQQYYAFWSEDEKQFCEACDEDTQIYHGLLLEEESYIGTSSMK